jgi:limonene-1,2-epoxide hydrolase
VEIPTNEQIRSINRRRFIATAGFGAATFGLAARVEAEWTAQEKANVKVVNDFLHARWNTEPMDMKTITSLLAEDCVRGARTTNFMRGRPVILEYLQRSSRETLKKSLEVIQTLALGPLVINERKELQVLPGRDGGPPRDVGGHVVGMFEVRDGQIKEWRTFAMTE